MNDSANEVINIHPFYHWHQLRISEQTVDHRIQICAAYIHPLTFLTFFLVRYQQFRKICQPAAETESCFFCFCFCIRIWKSCCLIIHKMRGDRLYFFKKLRTKGRYAMLKEKAKCITHFSAKLWPEIQVLKPTVNKLL